MVVPARNGAASADALLLLTGGPGQGAASLARAMLARTGSMRDTRDVILIDQRGTGASNGLFCEPPASAAAIAGKIFDVERLAACRDRLSARADLTRYTTSDSAADYAIVLDTLGVRQVNVWGVSYGTRLGYELARRFPGRVRTLILEGVVPVDFAWPTNGAPDLEAALNAVIDDCASDAACAAAYPTLRADVTAAFVRLDRDTAAVTVTDPATQTPVRVQFSSADLAYSVRGILYGAEAARLPADFRDAAGGRFEAFAQALVTRQRALDEQIADGVLFGVYCAEDLPFVDWTAAYAAAAGTRIGGYLLDEYRRGCSVWPRGSIPDAFRTPAVVTVPALLFSGRRDPVTPPRTAEDAARVLPRSRRLTWRYAGHGVDGIPALVACRTQVVSDFLDTADPARVDASCVQ